MQIVITNGMHVVLEEPEVFSSFGISATDPAESVVLGALGERGAAAPEKNHVFVSVAAVRQLAGSSANAAWEKGLASMLAFAESNGWLSNDGQLIKAHIECR